jgi:hypothetical protein
MQVDVELYAQVSAQLEAEIHAILAVELTMPNITQSNPAWLS